MTTPEDTAITANVLTDSNGGSADNFAHAGRGLARCTTGGIVGNLFVMSLRSRTVIASRRR